MSTTLITVLGKGRDNTQTGYREATYQFDRGEPYKTAYFGLALARHLNPDTLIMLGTSGSMWGVLVENHAIEGEDEELLLKLFQKTLKKNLRWASRDNTLDEQQRLLALRALERGDFLRTAILGLEALISRLCRENSTDSLDYRVREETDKKFQQEIKQDKLRNWKNEAYRSLKNLRNAMAHGIPPTHVPLQKLIKNEEILKAELERILSRLKA